MNKNFLFSYPTINNYEIIYIFWNLLLLIIPFLLCAYLIKYWSTTKYKKAYQKIVAVLLGLLWLLFIPNTAYVITDIRHLLGFCPLSRTNVCLHNAWMIMFFFLYASLGWIAYVYLVKQMEWLIKEIWDKTIAFIYIWTIVPVISIGILLGLIYRWNSWDIFLTPLAVGSDALKFFTDLTHFKNWAIFTLALYLLYFVGEYLFCDLNLLRKNKRDNTSK